jgi:hypothetical protein
VEGLASLGARTDGVVPTVVVFGVKQSARIKLILREEALMGLFAVGWKIGEAGADFLREQRHSCKSRGCGRLLKIRADRQFGNALCPPT